MSRYTPLVYSIPKQSSLFSQPSGGTSQTPTTYYTSGQQFTIEASGLKPSSIHYLSLGTNDVSSQCQPINGKLGDPLLTDANGQIQFSFFYNSGIDSATNVTASQALLNSVAGNKILLLHNTDSTSTATFNITINITSGQNASLIGQTFFSG